MNESAVGLISRLGNRLVGVRLSMADLGVSGYVIENGPGVCVRCEGWMYSPVPKFFVSSRSDVGLLAFGVSKFAGLAVRGEEFSMAAAYALERVLKAVGEVRSIPALSAVDDFPNVNAVVGVLI
jgi:hypothetical protein